MDASELTARLARSKAPPPEPEQLALLAELLAVYAELGVLQGPSLAPLHTVCPSASACWERIPEAARPHGVGQFDAASQKGCMILPWVGPRYRPGGVAVLGMNLRYGGADWEFAMEYRIVGDPAWGQEPALRAGKRAHGSYWSIGTMRDVVAIHRSWRGQPDLDAATPTELADALLESVRVQAVKCSPIGGRSTPEPAMNSKCPPRFLRKEIAVLRPSVILAYGNPAHGALRELGTLTLDAPEDGFRRGRLSHADGSLEVFLLTHPAHGRWHKAHKALMRSLAVRPVERATTLPVLSSADLAEDHVG